MLRKLFALPLIMLSSIAVVLAADCPAVLDHRLRALASNEAGESLCQHAAGRVVLVVNTASRCGYTPQLAGLEALYQRYRERGLLVMGFPSDDFNQELDNEADIARFCEINYGVEFPMFEKLHVRGEQAHPLFRMLATATASEPRWNFHKYLISRDGEQIYSFPTRVAPEDSQLLEAIEALLRVGSDGTTQALQ